VYTPTHLAALPSRLHPGGFFDLGREFEIGIEAGELTIQAI